ncbi:MAG: hypothetical protein PHD15_06880 [Clostridia bacterium]|nr:hypothetical protein [Clostridia bacterium]MDD4387453.1 hypothetical protein [Clostridia bacterium]
MNLPSHELRETLNAKLLLDQLINEKNVMEFDDDLIRKIKNTNVFLFRDFFQIFQEGLNIGSCGQTSRHLSYLFDDFNLIKKGICKILIGTKGAPSGEHAWLLIDGYVYDTTLMLKIKEETAYSVLGYEPYEQITSGEIMKDKLYVMQREMARDTSTLKWKKELIKEFRKCKLKCSYLGVQ